MPRVEERKRNRAGKPRSCGRCRAEILPGETYYLWKFRYGGERTNCYRHRPRQSELTQSIMGEVYSAIESAQDQLPNVDNLDDLRTLIEEVSTEVTRIADQYREAAEPFQGGGIAGERADELDSWGSELEAFDPDEPDVDDAKAEIEAQMLADGFSRDDEAEWISVYEARAQEDTALLGVTEEALDTARGEAEELLAGCPV